MKNFKLPKWAVVLVVALVFLPLAVDWAAPGAGMRLAARWLGGAVGGEDGRRMLFPLWGWLVGKAGKDVAALGWISVGAGLVCVWLVSAIVGAIFGAAVRGAKEGGVKGETYAWVENAAVLLAGLAFAFTPGFLTAATRLSPLMVALVPPLAAVTLVVWTATRAGRVGHAGRMALLIAVGLIGYSAFELALARRVLLALALPAVWVWFAVGMMPALVIAWCVRKRWLSGRKELWLSFGGWTAAVAVLGAVNFTLDKLDEGRVANRIVAAIIANAEKSGRVAVASDGALDELFFFMLPEKLKLISLAREREPEYGRELSDWVRGISRSSDFDSGQGEDLAFAAELGPLTLVDEWSKIDKPGFEAAVASTVNYFPTREKWDAACAELEGMRADEPMAKYLRRLLGVTGNALGCRLLEGRGESEEGRGESEEGRGKSEEGRGESEEERARREEGRGKSEEGRGESEEERARREEEAWAIFEKIVDSVDPKNYGAYLNLLGMVQRGYQAPKAVVEDLVNRRRQLENGFTTQEHLLSAVRSSGRLYATPEDMARYEQAKREAAEKREQSPEAKAFVEKLSAASKDPQSGRSAQEAIHKAIRDGRVRADMVGGQLIAIDLALGDMKNAEQDAIEVLKLDRHEPTANATLGSLAGSRGDYERSERYLRRAIATGRASIVAKNDYAYVLMKLGRLDEAEPFAREAMKSYGEAWQIRETLAAILIRKGKVEEGERELRQAEELLAKAGIPKGKIASIEIDRARILKAKGDRERLRSAIRSLRSRKDLTEAQKTEIRELNQ